MLYRFTLNLCLGLTVILLNGCASNPTNPTDPYESYNRAIFNFNNGFNKAIANPVVNTYQDVTPDFVQTGIYNFFNNVGTVPDIANDLLQGNFHYLGKDTLRFLLNTTLGCLGLIDVASQAGIPAHQQGFGYTLAKWGWSNSSYFILPFIGPNTVSGSFGLVVDYFASPITYVKPPVYSYALDSVEVLDIGATLLPKQNFIMKTSLDPYIGLKNAYMQNRAYVIQQIDSDGTDQNEN